MTAKVPTIPLGPTKQRIPVLGMGTWKMEEDPRAASIRALRRGLDLGLSLIDTAELYGSGKVEEIVGEAIAGRRDEVFLVTKVLPSNASRRGTVEALERSLARLGTDHVDLYLLHWSGRHPIADTMTAFGQLVDDGLTRYVGVSNLELDELDEAQKAAGDLALVTNQIYYWLGARACENVVLPGLDKRRVTVMAYSPFGSARMPAPDTRAGRALAEVAARHGATLHQVALAWVLRQPNLMTIPKTASAEHLEENVAALQLKLTDEDLRALDAGFPRPRTKTLEFL